MLSEKNASSPSVLLRAKNDDVNDDELKKPMMMTTTRGGNPIISISREEDFYSLKKKHRSLSLLALLGEMREETWDGTRTEQLSSLFFNSLSSSFSLSSSSV